MRSIVHSAFVLLILCTFAGVPVRAETGVDAWLRYARLDPLCSNLWFVTRHLDCPQQFRCPDDGPKRTGARSEGHAGENAPHAVGCSSGKLHRHRNVRSTANCRPRSNYQESARRWLLADFRRSPRFPSASSSQRPPTAAFCTVCSLFYARLPSMRVSQA